MAPARTISPSSTSPTTRPSPPGPGGVLAEFGPPRPPDQQRRDHQRPRPTLGRRRRRVRPGHRRDIKGWVANVIRHIVPAMIARDSGVIVNPQLGWGRSTSAERCPLLRLEVGHRGAHARPRQELPKGMAACRSTPGSSTRICSGSRSAIDRRAPRPTNGPGLRRRSCSGSGRRTTARRSRRRLNGAG